MMGTPSWQLNCPVNLVAQKDSISLAHGEGGRMMRRLLEEVIYPTLGTKKCISDAASLHACSSRLAFSTDSYVVSPLFFPGGDIGTLSVFGTVNDLAVSGAIPRWLSLSLIIEEGLPIVVLQQVLQSVAKAARASEVEIETGDTKVVRRGEADGLFLNTTGIGELFDPLPPGPQALQEGDVLIISGPVGRHGIAILAAREQLDFSPAPVSDCASLLPAVRALRQQVGLSIRSMRDATRGGLTAVLHEWAIASGKSLYVDERSFPTDAVVQSACELLGLEAMHLACEGTMLVSVDKAYAEQALHALRSVPVSQNAAIIGSVKPSAMTPVIIRRLLGREQSLDEPSGAPLPRIC